MDTHQLPLLLTAIGDESGIQSAPEQKLRLLLTLARCTRELTTELWDEISSPTQSALFTHVVEQAHHEIQLAQIRAAHTAQRTMITDLPAENLEHARAIAQDPDDFIDGTCSLPADPTTVPGGLMPFKTTADFLQGSLGISHFAAIDRLHAANALLPQIDTHGISQGPRYPKLADQLFCGASSLGAASSAARKLDKLTPAVRARDDHHALAARIEEKVAQSLATDTPRGTNLLIAAMARELEDTELAEPTPAEIQVKTGIFITRRTRNYTYMSLCMLNVDAEVFLSHFAQSDNAKTLAGNREGISVSATGMNPTPAPPSTQTPSDRPDWFIHPSTSTTLDENSPSGGAPLGLANPLEFNSIRLGADGLAPPQRHLQTILNLMRARKNSTTKGTTGLPTAQLIIHCRLDTLLGLAKGAGWSSHGLQIPISEVRRRLATDGVIPMVLGGDSEILDLGREQRLAPDYMRRALLARDGGCFYPGCSVPPEHCEICHIDAFAEGGITAIHLMTPGCASHHHLADAGLLILMIYNGLPHVLLPKHLDPAQIPRRNTYWRPVESTLF